MRHLTTLIRTLRQIEGTSCIINNPQYREILNLYKGLDYKELTVLSRIKNKDNIVLYENDNIILKFNIHNKFSHKQYNRGLIKLLDGNISLEDAEEIIEIGDTDLAFFGGNMSLPPNNKHFSYSSFLKKGQAYEINKNTILNNPTSCFAHLLSIEQ